MEQLRELEERVFDIIEKNKELHKTVEQLKAENREIRVANEKFQAALRDRDQNTHSLDREKAALKSTICELIESIDSLQATK